MIVQRILVVDDDPEVCSLLELVSKQMDLPCASTHDAESFLRALTPEITLIFLDLVIPGMDGVEILRILSERKSTARILLMSGLSKRVIESAVALGQSLGLSIVGYLAKPFVIAELERALLEHSDSKPTQAAGASERIPFKLEELRRAVERDEFVLHFQPQIDAQTGAVIGVEGLVRWKHPERGLIYPDSFIETIEELGLMDAMTLLVFQHGLSEISRLAAGGHAALSISLNVSASSLRDLSFPDRFVGIVRGYGVAPENVVLEVTESGLIDELSQTLDVLTRLRMMRVRLSIDDFGTGYSMMQQLRNVPATEIKIDKSIVQNMHSERDRVIARKIIELGHELGMKVVAEGVETEEQREFLRAMHCDILQGYLYAKPLPSDRLADWFADYQLNV
jgi:EAL domain-containing protein (putative c-di-GMP-specific phosphodiesterase class I)